MTKVKVYFPGLNGLRFFAALAVIFTHIELIKKNLGFSNFWYDSETHVRTYPLESILHGDDHWLNPLVAVAGPLGVVFFFVLSGFLITYLLLVERQKTTRISIKNFYLRRILRIWPLYFFIFFLGFFVLPHFESFYVPIQSEDFEVNFWGNFVNYLFILPNLALSMFTAVPCIGQSWSIGVEEQFYIVWPIIIKFFKKPIHAIVGVTILLLMTKAGVMFASESIDTPWFIYLKKFLAMSKIECMTIGAAGAWLIFENKTRVIQFIHHPWVQVMAYLGTIGLIYLTPKFIQDGIHMMYGVLFLIIIMNVSGNKRSFIKLENKLMNVLGKISYGIYMYHLIVVIFVVHFAVSIFGKGGELGIGGNALIYLMSIGLTLTVSWLSYELFEYPFIKKKAGLSKIISGEDAQKK